MNIFRDSAQFHPALHCFYFLKSSRLSKNRKRWPPLLCEIVVVAETFSLPIIAWGAFLAGTQVKADSVPLSV